MPENTPISQATDAGLLSLIAARHSDREAAKEAWAEFYNRYIKYVFAICRKAFNGVADHECIAQETMELAFKGAHTFRSNGETDEAELKTLIRRWLNGIAKNAFLTVIQREKQKPVSVRFVDPERLERRRTHETIPTEYPTVRDALSQLSDRERDVILTWLQFGDPCDRNSHIPDDALDDACKKLQVTPENFRQVKRRALTKLEKMLQSPLNEVK